MPIATSKLHAVQPDASLKQARLAIEAGENNLKKAAQHLADAQEAGASQRQMAEAVGKSAAWVNRLLKWREGGFKEDTPFGPQSKAARAKKKDVQPPERKPDPIWDEDASTDSSTADPQKSVSPKTAVSEDKSSPLEWEPQTRRRLIKALRALSSMSSTQRAEAALKVSQIRKRSGLSWEDLIIEASSVDLKTAA